MTQLSAIDIVVCLLYLTVVFGLAWMCARGQEDNEDYFVGGRTMNWWAVGISMFATSFSAISFLAFPQRGAYLDYSFFLTILFIPFVITPILWFIFVPMYIRLRVSSGYEYLGKRFGLTAQRIGATLYCAYSIGWMGTMLYAVALTLQTVMGLNDTQYLFALIGIGLFATLYTVLGGLKAVVWTDVMQAIVLGGTVLIILLMIIARIDGGWPEFLSIANQHNKFQMIHLNADLLAAENFTTSNSVYTALAYGLFMYLPGYAVSQNMIQRFVCAGSLSAGRGIVLLSGLINVVLGFLFMFVGTALFVFYSQEGGLGMPEVGVEIIKEDQILPYFVSTQLPGVGLTGLILAGLFAAAMSTMDSGINGVTSVVVYDWMQGKHPTLTFSRRLTAVLGIVVIVVALVVPRFDKSVIDILMTIASTFLGFLLAMFLLGLFSRRANLPGVLLGLATGTACLLGVMMFTDIPKWWYGAFAIIPTILAGELFSLIFAPPPATALEGTIYRSGDESN